MITAPSAAAWRSGRSRGLEPSVAPPIICRSALAIEAHRAAYDI
ncbi:hypothetical protein [Verminephrobacter eiseniae]|nr:hypothetical protein [Verminephrobacter eiseniae]